MDTNQANIDPSEITKFSELAHKWWEPTGELAALHHINPTRPAYINARVTLIC